MSKVKGFTVTLEDNLNEEDFQRIKDAVLLTEGVLDVTPIEANPGEDHIIRMRTKNEVMKKLFKLINDL